MRSDTGGPAFPVYPRIEGGEAQYIADAIGMTLRDYFAAKAMQSIVSVLHAGIRPTDLDRMARDAYGIADVMLRERQS